MESWMERMPARRTARNLAEIAQKQLQKQKAIQNLQKQKVVTELELELVTQVLFRSNVQLFHLGYRQKNNNKAFRAEVPSRNSCSSISKSFFQGIFFSVLLAVLLFRFLWMLLVPHFYRYSSCQSTQNKLLEKE
jgi:hypothetical protein